MPLFVAALGLVSNNDVTWFVPPTRISPSFPPSFPPFPLSLSSLVLLDIELFYCWVRHCRSPSETTWRPRRPSGSSPLREVPTVSTGASHLRAKAGMWPLTPASFTLSLYCCPFFPLSNPPFRALSPLLLNPGTTNSSSNFVFIYFHIHSLLQILTLVVWDFTT